jgi:hypothetical protein
MRQLATGRTLAGKLWHIAPFHDMRQTDSRPMPYMSAARFFISEQPELLWDD